ncbi:MAG: aldo/keto reductase [Ruminococcus sp.]|nr:aldo/keto reductase [Ruminococcus sp.]
MKYTKLGSSDLNVSRICMGCMGFGDPQRGQHSWTIDEAHTREIIKRGLALGVNFYDTAIAYQSGSSEQYVGRTLRDFAKREEVVVATKFLPRTAEEIENGISGQQHIENMINTSLSNLGIDRVAALAEKHGVSMTEIALAWLLTKVDSPVVGATKLHHIEGAAKAVDCVLTEDEIACLEEPYVPHPLAGVMAQNKRENAKQKHVWSTGDQTIREE